ncbi:MAG: nucleotide exchange factor GrpE [Deltaproteobacteria bacterium]|nr:nucleotide exchange factor GrpE [Deltaproteobacteria bacterium]MBW1873028.1 nucleotide exchange factor GrpE [Deltaproteobacteria bacterium]
MSEQDQKGYTVEIPDEAIKDALESVNKKSKPSDPEATADDSSQAPDPEKEIEVQVEVSEEKSIDEERTGPSRQELINALEQAREAARVARERMLRGLADADNQRKRLVKERQEIVKFSQEGLLRDFLIPLDNLERTLEHIPQDTQDTTLKSLVEGLKMVVHQFTETLSKHDLTSFNSVGELFDPSRHEALSQTETSEYDPGTILTELHRGYMLHDRLLRAALVTVACKPGEGSNNEGGEQEDKTPQTDQDDSAKESNGN